MRPHPRIRKTIKWGGAAVTVLLVVAWIGSGWWSVGWAMPIGVGIGIDVGSISFTLFDPAKFTAAQLGLHSGYHAPRFFSWFTFFASTFGYRNLSIPLWLPAIVALGCAVIAWRADASARERGRLNLCPMCNYDRAGIAGDAMCPECGAKPAGT